MNLILEVGGFKTVFSVEQEKILCDYILYMEAKLFAFDTLEIRELAFDLAKKLKISNPFNGESELAGIDWVKNFLKRHKQLTYRKPEPTSAARASGFNKEAVAQFFDLYEKVLDEFKFAPEDIYNVDETYVTVVPKSCGKVIGMKGKRKIGCLTSAERGKLVTVELCMSANGKYMPPLLIFPLVRRNSEYLNGACPGAWAEFNSSGWMNGDVFAKWMKKFISFSRASKDKPVLLILDGHNSHTKNIEVIDMAMDNGVVMLSLPPHTTHRMQPLDLAFMKPLSTYMTSELKKCIRKQEGKPVIMKQLFELFSNAFLKAATVKTAVDSFKKPGLYPFNRNVFKDEDFLACNNSFENFEVDESDDNLELTNEMANTTPKNVEPLASSSQPSASTKDTHSNSLEDGKL